MKQKLKLFSIVFWTALTVALGFVAVFLLALRFNLITSFHAYVVSSGSMEPAMKMGSVILVKQEPTYRVSDVIAFRRGGSSDTIVTHRVALAYRSEEFWKELTYVTRGDANKDFDQERVRDSDVVGRAILTIPYVGYGVNAAKTPKGFIAFVIIPATIIVYEEVKALSAELKKTLRKIKQKFHKHQILLHPLHLSESQKFQKAAVVIPFAGVALAVISISGSFFFDRETSAENLISVLAPTPTLTNDLQSIPTPTPTPTDVPPTPTPTIQGIANHLVVNEVFYKVDNDHKIENSAGKGEWVEIYNPTQGGVNVNGWKVRDNNQLETLPDLTIPAGGFLIVSPATESQVRAIWSIPAEVLFVDVSGSEIGDGLANNDRILLENASATPIDEVSWGNDTSAFNPSVGIVPDGHSIERDPDGKDTDSASDFVDQTPPQPGQ